VVVAPNQVLDLVCWNYIFDIYLYAHFLLYDVPDT